MEIVSDFVFTILLFYFLGGGGGGGGKGVGHVKIQNVYRI
jgi:hypothetical protein